MSEKKMLKIYDPENERYLLALGISEEEVANIKYRELHKAVSEKLFEIAEAFKRCNFNFCEEQLAWSPSGDAHGCDNHYLSFEYLTGDEGKDDLGDIIHELLQLKRHNEGE